MTAYAEGLKLSAAGRHAEAICAFERALAESPADTRVLFALGNTARSLGMGDAAETFYRQVLNIEPGRLEAVVNLVNLLRSLGRFEEAGAVIRPVLAQFPQNPDLLLAEGSLKRETGALGEAMKNYRAALAARPGYVPALVNLADLEADSGNFEDALELYGRAIKLEPGNGQARLNRAILHLLRGELSEGWRDYAARLKVAGKVPLPEHNLKRWDGGPLKRTRLLVTAEQGVGDHLMFASLYPELAARAAAEGGCLILECDPRLQSLFARSFPAALVHGWDIETKAGIARTRYGWLKALGGANAFIEMGSLPKLMRKTLCAFPNPNAYLIPDAEEAARWRETFAALPRPWIGICWRSGSTGGARAVQYAALKEWAEFLSDMPGSAIVAQYDARESEIAELESMSGRTLTRPSGIDQKLELDRAAAMLSVMDAVVSAPTAVSWLAASIGRPVLKPLYDTSWTSFGESYEPFAPSARLLMPKERGDWADALAKARDAISALPL